MPRAASSNKPYSKAVQDYIALIQGRELTRLREAGLLGKTQGYRPLMRRAVQGRKLQTEAVMPIYESTRPKDTYSELGTLLYDVIYGVTCSKHEQQDIRAYGTGSYRCALCHNEYCSERKRKLNLLKGAYVCRNCGQAGVSNNPKVQYCSTRACKSAAEAKRRSMKG